MSSRNEPEQGSVGERIHELRRSLPPAEGRRSRLGYISQDDLAAMLGTVRTRVIAWENGNAYPEQRYREKLAKLSGGRYQADDFAPPSDPARVVDDEALAALVREAVRDVMVDELVPRLPEPSPVTALIEQAVMLMQSDESWTDETFAEAAILAAELRRVSTDLARLAEAVEAPRASQRHR